MAIYIRASGTAPTNEVRVQCQAPEHGSPLLYRQDRPIPVADTLDALASVLNNRYKVAGSGSWE